MLLSGCGKSDTEEFSASTLVEQPQSQASAAGNTENIPADGSVSVLSESPSGSETGRKNETSVSQAAVTANMSGIDSSVSAQSDTQEVMASGQKAAAGDAAVIADRVIYYLNIYRNEQGVTSAQKLTGLAKYAEYRGRQLISNFAHDTADERAAATVLQYGMYVDPAA